MTLPQNEERDKSKYAMIKRNMMRSFQFRFQKKKQKKQRKGLNVLQLSVWVLTSKMVLCPLCFDHEHCQYIKMYEQHADVTWNHLFQILGTPAIFLRGAYSTDGVLIARTWWGAHTYSHFVPSVDHLVPRPKSQIVPNPKGELITDGTSSY